MSEHRAGPRGHLADGGRAGRASGTGSVERERVVWQICHELLIEVHDGVVRRISRSAVPILGRPPESMLGKPWLELVHRDDHASYAEALARGLDAERIRSTRLRLRRGDASWVWVEWEGVVCSFEGADGVAALSVVLAGRPESSAKAEVDDQADLFRILADNVPGTVYLCRNDAQYSMLYLSEVVVELTGRPSAQFLNGEISFVDLYHPDDSEQIVRTVDEALELHRPFHLEYRIEHADGRYRWVEEHGQGVWGADGELLYLEGALFDITTRYEADLELRRSQERFARVFSSHPEPAVVAELPSGTILEVNSGFCELSGLGREQLVGEPGLSLGLFEPPVQEKLASQFLAGESIREIEEVLLRADGTQRNVILSAVEIEMGERPCVLITARDVTERRVLERQLLRAQRMKSIGTLAGGIAHDLNNVLTPIQMGVSLLRTAEASEREELLDIIEANARRGADMIRRVLSFARGAEGARRPVEPADLLAELESILRETFPRGIELDLTVEPDLGLILADPTQLHQVLLNLCLNARDAMGNRGHLQMRVVGRDTIQEQRSQVPAGRPYSWVVFEVVDDGCGIESEVLGRVTEPFFTTKPLGQGTGLGLSTASTILSNHGGFLEFDSLPGQGSTFRAFLPTLEEGELTKQEPPEFATTTGGQELILVVDDEPLVRETVGRVLVENGYELLTAADGDEALAQIDGSSRPIDLLVLDMMMPGRDGPATLRALSERGLNLPVIAVSGLAPPPGLGDSVSFLAKPFTADQLLRLVRTTLAARPAASDP